MKTENLMRAMQIGDQVNAGYVAVLRVINEVSDVTGIPVAEIRGKRRTKRLAMVRQFAMFVAREETDARLTEIAAAFNRDHSTVIYGIRAEAARRAQ